MVIKLSEKDKTISRPLFKIYLSDNAEFNNPVELKGLFDTGADISFIEHTLTASFNFSFVKRVDRIENADQLLYVGYIKIPELSDAVEKIEFSKRAIHNKSTIQDDPDFLLGRDFLKNCLLVFDGPGLQMEVTKQIIQKDN